MIIGVGGGGGLKVFIVVRPTAFVPLRRHMRFARTHKSRQCGLVHKINMCFSMLTDLNSHSVKSNFGRLTEVTNPR